MKAIRIAIAAAFGVATTVPALADFESYGPNDKQGQGITTLSEVNPPSLDNSSPMVADGRYLSDADRVTTQPAPVIVDRDGRVYRSDRDYVAENRYNEGRFHRFFHRDQRSMDYRANNGVAEPGEMSSWDRSGD